MVIGMYPYPVPVLSKPGIPYFRSHVLCTSSSKLCTQYLRYDVQLQAMASTEIFGISVLISDHDCDKQPSYEYCGEGTKRV